MDLKNPATSQRFATDPTADDVTYLETLINLSPMCYDVPKSCQEMDVELFRDQVASDLDFWLFISNGGTDGWDGFFTEYVEEITAIMGRPPIFIDTKFENPGSGCRDADSIKFNVNTAESQKCYSRSLIDVVNRIHEVAEFLGVDFEGDNGNDKLVSGQEEACTAAQRFSDVAADAHSRGIRVAGVWFDVYPEEVYIAPYSALGNAFTRTLEELGLPYLHPGICLQDTSCRTELWGPDYETINSTSWFVNCQPGQEFSTCNEATLYNADLYIVEGRDFTVLEQNKDFFAKHFPDKAILQGQYVHTPLNDGAISYHNIARHLNYVADKLEKAEPLYPNVATKSACADVDVTSDQHTSNINAIEFNSLLPGEFACYNKAFHQAKYMECPEVASAGSAAIARAKSSLVASLVLMALANY